MKPGMATFLKRVVYTTAKRYSAAFNRISFESCLFVNLSTSSTSTALIPPFVLHPSQTSLAW